MAITVTQRPSIASPAACKWNAVGNPILYKFTRKDNGFNQVNNNAGNIQMQFNSVDITANHAVNDVVWVKSDNGVYDSVGTLTAVTFSSPNTLITVNIPYTSAAPGGYVNNNTQQRNYKLSIGVYSGTTLLGTNRYSPDRRGDIIADISRTIWSSLSPDFTSDLTTVDTYYSDSGASIDFHIKYTETWIGGANSQTDDVANIFYAVYGARQIPSATGGNMYEYVTNTSASLINDTAFNVNWTNEGSGDSWTLGATSLDVNPSNSKSKRARRSVSASAGEVISVTIGANTSDDVDVYCYLSNGQSFLIARVVNATVIYTKAIYLTSDITYAELEADDRSTLSSPTLSIIDVDIDEVTLNKFLTKLDTIVKWRDWPCPISIIVPETQANDVYLDVLDSSEASVDSPNIGEIITYDLGSILVTELLDDYSIVQRDYVTNAAISLEIGVTIKDACDNPVMLLGRNTLGGILTWVFDYSQEYTFNYDDGRKAKRLLLTAENLTLNQWESLQDFITLGEVYRENITELLSTTIKTSSRIGSQVYAVDQEGNKIGVIVIPTQNTTRTKQERHVFQIEIEYPQEFNA